MNSMYFVLYNLLQQYVYGLDVALTPDMQLTLTILSTIGSLFVVLFPFFVVWRIIRVIVG